MRNLISSIVTIFLLIVFVTFMVNHGQLDFSGVDKVRNKTHEILESEEGQDAKKEVEEISKDVFKKLFTGFTDIIKDELHDNNKDTTKSSSTVNKKDIQECVLESVVDGDTLWVLIDGEKTKIRLIGVDTPESVHSDASKNNEYGVMASNYTKQVLEGRTTLYLEYDKEKTDQYGRTLAYVWLVNDLSNFEANTLNAMLVSNGYAYDKVYMPNNKYADILYDLRTRAEENGIGLWQYEEFANLWAYILQIAA